MRIVLAGGSGFLGRALSARLREGGHEVTVLTRQATPPPAGPGLTFVTWDPDGSVGEWAYHLDGTDIIVNLSGAGMADKRWSTERKEELRASRVRSTRSLVTAIRIAKQRPAMLIQGSAVGYYGTATPNQQVDESYPPGDDFLADLAVAWEAEALPATALGCRVVIARSGVVLARDGGALQKLLPPFRFFVGGPIGSGRQPFSWVHLRDWIEFMVWLTGRPGATGVYNLTAPAPVTNREFSAAVGRAVHRPSWLPVPAVALRVAFGEMADTMLIRGQRVVPTRALAEGFTFSFPLIDAALADLLARAKTA